MLKEQVEAAKKEFGVDKVNIIGHSMGGLDARHMITNMGGAEWVSSLFTIGTPHRGSFHCDWYQFRFLSPMD